MRAVSVLVMLLGVAAGLGWAAEQGRKAEIHLQDRSVVKCLVLSFAEGKFEVDEGGTPRSIDIAAVDRVVFGEAVGEYVRGLLAPPKPGEPREPVTTAPAAVVRPGEPPKRALELPLLVRRLSNMTNRFEDAERVKKVEAEITRSLATTPEKGRPDKHLRLSLAVLKIAKGDAPAARKTLDDLRIAYPEDLFLEKVTVGTIEKVIDRWKGEPPPRGPKRHAP